MSKKSNDWAFSFIYSALISVCFILASSLFFGSYAFTANEKTRAFIHAHEQFAKEQSQTKKSRFDTASPWAPYLKQQFSKGFTAERLEKSLTLERQGRCDQVLTLVQTGFVQLYPDLKFIFLKAPILDVFEEEIAPRFSHRYRRCMAWRNLHFVIERSKRNTFDSFAPYIDLPSQDFKYPPQAKGGKDLRFKRAAFQGLNGLVRLGLCHGDKASLKDLDYLSLKLYPGLFSESEALYMDAFSAQYGVKSMHYQRVKDRLNDGKGPKPISREPLKVLSMQARLQAGDMDKAQLLVGDLITLCEQEVVFTFR